MKGKSQFHPYKISMNCIEISYHYYELYTTNYNVQTKKTILQFKTLICKQMLR